MNLTKSFAVPVPDGELAANISGHLNQPPTVNGKTVPAGFWDMNDLLANVPICRRTASNLMREQDGLPFIKLRNRTVFHPESVLKWMLRRQRGG
jgi:hypothetical protein